MNITNVSYPLLPEVYKDFVTNPALNQQACTYALNQWNTWVGSINSVEQVVFILACVTVLGIAANVAIGTIFYNKFCKKLEENEHAGQGTRGQSGVAQPATTDDDRTLLK